ncbi:MAG: hypothetical protein HRU20_28060 [Pseudomonadales bacterium]|nr:hypothetical protein [Pseudomonadales bacterium]
MEELAEGAFKGILKVISLAIRSLIWLILEFFFEVIGWYVGWPICRVLSFGHYPENEISDHEQASKITVFVVSLVGVIVLIGIATALAILVGAG